jgi:hypothetical protein
VGAIDLPLTLLAAVGAVEAARSARTAAVALAAIAFGLGLGLVDVARAGPLAPKPDRIPHEVMWLARVGSSFWVGPGRDPIDIPIAKSPGTPPWDLSMLQIDLAITDAGRGGGCRAVTVRFRPAEQQEFSPGRSVRIFLPAEIGSPPSRGRRLTIGSTIPLALDGAGTVRLEFECASPATAEIGTMAVIAPRREIFYRDRFLERERRP